MADACDFDDLTRRLRASDTAAAIELFTACRDRLKRMVRLRLDRRLQGRLDASDVLQEAFVEIASSLADYLRDPAMPFFLWLRTLTGRKLHALHQLIGQAVGANG